MAFRKTVKCRNSIGNYHGFCERKTKSVNDGSAIRKQVLSDFSVYEINDSALPVLSVTDVKNSGVVIDGNVDFSPNDPSNFNEVQNRVGDYVNSINETNINENEN